MMNQSQMIDYIIKESKRFEEVERRRKESEEINLAAEMAKEDERIARRIRPEANQVLMYEDPHRQEAARKTVDVEKFEEKALVAFAREGNFKPSKDEQDHAFLIQLPQWFKESFRWVDSPPCESCSKETTFQGRGVANPTETSFAAFVVELYRCTSCSNITRFPRYNDPQKLVETRKGRCGEWANCFTLYCRAFGYDSRMIMDFTDHVWTECYSPYLGRWMHLDPCEGVYDNPLLYEEGWGKKLNYVIAIAKDGVYDVTKRYTRKWPEVLSRRNITTESKLVYTLSNITRECRKDFTSQAISALEERDNKEMEELKRNLYSKDDPLIVLPGRESGNKEWGISKSEFGSDSLSSSSCPIRRCIDQHVMKIYDSFFPIISHLVENSSSKLQASEIFVTFSQILVDLQSSPFRTRRSCINPDTVGVKDFMSVFPYFIQLLNALSLKSEVGENGKIYICLASDPVQTSLSLPVVFHALDDVIHNVKECKNFDKSALSFPLLKLNRINSGFVLASGEELPFGIATSAFDGTHLSKWEDPKGSTGCWIIYKVSESAMHELVAYELMSANDAPERDPKEWVVEGSEDGGSSWHVLDKRSSQIFDKRFERRGFKVETRGFLANSFRIRFLAVRDSKENSRFQVGSIDLYAQRKS